VETDDAELAAMAAVRNAVSDLDEDIRTRVIRWAAERFKVNLDGSRAAATTAGGAGRQRGAGGSAGRAGDQTNEDAEFEDFADLFDRAAPKTDQDKTLVGGYWFQVAEGKQTFVAQEVNDKLKHLGHKVGNVTRALTGLQEKKPALVLQMRKEGKTQQARKLYKLSAAGVAEVRRMLGGEER
jgi:hypothetical protein